jgi:hypothetical protein
MAFELPPEDRAYVEAAQRLVALTPETLRVRTDTVPAALILVALMHRGAKTALGANLLCDAGYGEQALILGRTLFEDMIDAHWVSTDPVEAVRRFDDASLIARKLNQDRVEPYREHVEDLLPPESIESTLTEEEASRLNTLLRRHRHGSWTRLGLRRRIDDVAHMFGDGADRNLLMMFADLGEGLASDFVHGSVQSVYSQLDLDGLRRGDGINFHVGPSSRYVRPGALLCGWSFAHLLSAVFDHLEVGGRDELEAAYFALMELTNAEGTEEGSPPAPAPD